ncbi:MAG: class I SAM-dependent methyltransferase [Chloroflexi bacterium]|nr:class I SAM-dependent methyltransferase [Chloroflexota bacterium]
MTVEQTDSEIKKQVGAFYNEIGWKKESSGFFQNARYEDLRPVAREYIHRCHLRVNRFLQPSGRFLLDAGSGPVQWPEYLTYSQNYTYRICLDISIVALSEARTRLGDKGLYVVSDVAHLPFKSDVFDGLVSLHTLHHIPPLEQPDAYAGFVRVLKPDCSGVVVNAWTSPLFMEKMQGLVTLMDRVNGILRRLKFEKTDQPSTENKTSPLSKPTGTYTLHITPDWLKQNLKDRVDFKIFVWRSVSVRFLRSVIQPWLLGRFWLRILYWLEERNPGYYGENGQYPLIVIRKLSPKMNRE